MNSFSNTIIKEIKIPSNVNEICEKAFYKCSQLRKFFFANDSKLIKIESYFLQTNFIDSIVISSSVVDLQEVWFSGLAGLKSIKVMPNNPKYCSLYDKILLEKSVPSIDKYDSIIYCIVNPGKIEIPNYIISFDTFSFVYCRNIFISFQNNSKLSYIADRSFAYSSITSFCVPSEVTIIGKEAFYSTKKLQIFEFDEDILVFSVDIKSIINSQNALIMIPSKIRYKCKFDETSEIEFI